MTTEPGIKQSRWYSKCRLLLWIWLLSLTCGILLWPVAVTPDLPLPLQSVGAIPHFVWFTVLFFAWVFALGFLLWLCRGKAFECLSLSLVFVMVFIGFWVLVNPWGMLWDSPWLLGHVQYLKDTGIIPAAGQTNLNYFDFPGLSILGVAISELTGLDVFTMSVVYLVLATLVFTTIVYTSFLTLSQDPARAASYAIVAIVVSPMLWNAFTQFHPISLASIYIALFFLIHVRRLVAQESGLGFPIILIILLLAATIEYVFPPVLFAIVLVVTYVYERLTRAKTPTSSFLVEAGLIIVVFMTWLIYLTVYVIPRMGGMLMEDVLTGGVWRWFLSLKYTIEASTNLNYPWWVDAAKTLRLVLAFGLGSIITAILALRIRNVRSRDGALSVFFVACLLVAGLGGLAAGDFQHGGVSRYQWVAPLVLIPVLGGLLARLRWLPLGRASLALSLLVVFPTFLSNATTFAAERSYLTEVVAVRFINNTYGTAKGMDLYGMPFFPAVGFIYTPEAHFAGAYLPYRMTAERVWQDLNQAMAGFKANSPDHAMLAASISKLPNYKGWVGITMDDPNWVVIGGQIAAFPKVYDNGTLQLYIP